MIVDAPKCIILCNLTFLKDKYFISDVIKNNWINLELYFQSMEFSNFYRFFLNFCEYFEFIF